MVSGGVEWDVMGTGELRCSNKEAEGDTSRLSIQQKLYPRLVKAIRRAIRKKYAYVSSLPLC